MKTVAEDKASLSFERGAGPGRSCPLGRRCDALLPSLAMVDKECDDAVIVFGKVQGGSVRKSAVGLHWGDDGTVG